MNGVAGALLGALLGGSALQQADSRSWSAIEGVIGHRFLNPDIYFIDFLPTELHMQDLLIATGAAILMSLVATSILPGGRAAWCRPGNWGIDAHGCDKRTCGPFYCHSLWETPTWRLSRQYAGGDDARCRVNGINGIQLIERQ